MSERRGDEFSGLTSGDPLAPGPAPERAGARPEPEAERTAMRPAPEAERPAMRPAPEAERTAMRPAPEAERPGGSALPGPAAPEHPGGYTSPPPPGAFGGAAAATAPYGTGSYRLAGWWSRVAAALIDGLIVGVGGILLMVLIGAIFSAGFFAGDEVGVVSLVVGLFIAFLAFAVVALLYAPWMMARTDGRTLGRMAMNIRVVRANGEPMSFSFAMLREVAVKWLLFGMIAGSVTFGLAYFVDVLWPLWDEENRALHDIIVDTRVVKD
jgi:uncharacterized RDD family membrane protein YckC